MSPNLDIKKILKDAVDARCSDIHIAVGVPPVVRVFGALQQLQQYPVLTGEDTELLAQQVLTDEQFSSVFTNGDVDFAVQYPDIGRFRANVFKQRKCYGMVFRVLSSNLPTLESLKLPPIITTLAQKPRGLILVTGPTGSGKSTTLAAMIDYINRNREDHILTLEDPVEFVHPHKKCVVNQREVGDDTTSFARALRGALREDPDVILVGEMRDLETISAAVTAAETGHLVLSTLHTKGAASTIDRIIDSFPAEQQTQIRMQLVNVLEGVITQDLVPRADGIGRALAMEIMIVNDAVKNLIREGKIHQVNQVMQTSLSLGMQPMDYHLAQLTRKGLITIDAGMKKAMDKASYQRYLNMNI